MACRAGLTTLRKLDIRVCKLDQDDLMILGGLPALSTLALICIYRKKAEQTIPPGFPSVEVFSFDSYVPWVTFEQGAMPKLKNLHLKLYACPADKFPSGIINLRRLEKITIRYSPHNASSGGVKKVVAAMREHRQWRF